MNRKSLLILIALLYSIVSFSQYDYKKQGKSVVQVWVDIPGSDPNVCTGFVWKQKDWVVTSLHAMHPNGKVKILYGDFWNSNVEVIRIHEKADLVLLKVNAPAEFPPDIVPIPGANTNPIAYEEGLSSIGYNMGARSAQPKSLVRGGSMKKETLKNTLPPDVVEKLESFRIPDVNIEIMMLEGSLLPGYSGSPIFYKKDGSLVAIGDGGLDAGTKNVSWGIPAKYLAELENSPLVSKIPFGIESSPLHYSSAVKVKNKETGEKLNNVNEEANFEEYFELLSEDYAGIRYGDYEFYYVKTRTYQELYATSFDTENLDKLRSEFETMGLFLDFDLFEFDVYEDPFNEIIIVVPAGMPLIVDDGNNLRADLTNFPMGGWFYLGYNYEPNYGSNWATSGSAIVETLNMQALGGLLGGWSVNDEYSFNYDLDEFSSIGWLLLSAQYPYYNEADGESYSVSSYLGLLVNQNLRFYSNAVMYMPQIAEEYAKPEVILDCKNDYGNNIDACNYFESYMKIVIASHLTSFSYIQYEEYEGD